MIAVTIYIVFWSATTNKRLTLDFVCNVEIESSWKTFTDTAKFQLPKKILIVDQDKLSDYVKRGDRVTVHIGYDDKTNPEFEGFVSRIDANIPITIHCEDNMYLFKSGSITKGYSKTNLQTVMDDIISYYNGLYPGYGFTSDVIDVDLGSFRYTNLTGVQILEKLKTTYGLFAYFRNTVLHVGFPYNSSRTRNKIKYEFYRNIIESNLEYRTSDEVKIKVKAISTKSDNSKITIDLGDADGDIRTLNFYNLDQTGLQKAAEAEMKRLKFNGYKGTFKTFGTPYAQHGDVADIKDPDYIDRAGSFEIDSVKTIAGVKGIKRIIELGPSVI